MHGLQAQLREIDAIAQSVQARPTGTDVVICVPSTLIARAAQSANGRIGIGGEDCSPEMSGAYTGDTSAEMLKDAGASVVIVGHSERRQHYAESDAIVAKKAEAAARAGLSVILCIGENAAQRKEGAHLSVCGALVGGASLRAVDFNAVADVAPRKMPQHTLIDEFAS